MRGSETSSFQEDKDKPPGSTLMDIALLVSGTDYYHVECQMKNDSEMVIRMFAYDVRFAITHSGIMDKDAREITLHFPRSEAEIQRLQKLVDQLSSESHMP